MENGWLECTKFHTAWTIPAGTPVMLSRGRGMRSSCYPWQHLRSAYETPSRKRKVEKNILI